MRGRIRVPELDKTLQFAVPLGNDLTGKNLPVGIQITIVNRTASRYRARGLQAERGVTHGKIQPRTTGP